MLAEALLSLSVASVLIRFASFERAVRFASRRALGASQTKERSAERVVWSVKAASARMPWRTVCFHKGIAVQWMMRRRGMDARLHYGIGHGPARDLEAHVWVTVDRRVMVGGEEARRFNEVAVFPESGAALAQGK
jgi:hypothetical protein